MDTTYTFDLQRIFLGEQPLYLAFEIIFRTLVMFVYLLLALRFLGSRGLGQLSLFEFALIIALGSAVGDPMFYPEIPLLHGIVVITMVVALQRILVSLTNTNQRIENFIEGVAVRLVIDGEFDLDGLSKASLSRDELFMTLRMKGLEHLGQIRRAYFEPNGHISVYVFDDQHTRTGLPLFPLWDTDLPHPLCAGDAVPEAHRYACLWCGHQESLSRGQALTACPRCNRTGWTKAHHRVTTIPGT